jgi:hypothetical protein
MMKRGYELTMKRIFPASTIVSILLLTGCLGTKTQSESTKPAGAPARAGEANAATISGKVSFTGKKPVMRTIDMSASLACAHAHNGPVKSEEVVVNDNGTLKYVFVWVKSGVADRLGCLPPIASS